MGRSRYDRAPSNRDKLCETVPTPPNEWLPCATIAVQRVPSRGISMVNLPQLREFVTFAKYLNISKAADVLFTSQSNLSKHLKQLEGDLGFNLTCKKGNRIYLTDEGSHFLSGIQSVLCDYDQLVEECQLIQKKRIRKAHAARPAVFRPRLRCVLRTGQQHPSRIENRQHRFRA